MFTHFFLLNIRVEAERVWSQKVLEEYPELVDRFRVLNVSFSAYRADAHLGYKVRDNDVKLDCLHWCMPGVPDYWNWMLYNLVSAD
jgi:hypothetical protein